MEQLFMILDEDLRTPVLCPNGCEDTLVWHSATGRTGTTKQETDQLLVLIPPHIRVTVETLPPPQTTSVDMDEALRREVQHCLRSRFPSNAYLTVTVRRSAAWCSLVVTVEFGHFWRCRSVELVVTQSFARELTPAQFVRYVVDHMVEDVRRSWECRANRVFITEMEFPF